FRPQLTGLDLLLMRRGVDRSQVARQRREKRREPANADDRADLGEQKAVSERDRLPDRNLVHQQCSQARTGPELSPGAVQPLVSNIKVTRPVAVRLHKSPRSGLCRGVWTPSISSAAASPDRKLPGRPQKPVPA